MHFIKIAYFIFLISALGGCAHTSSGKHNLMNLPITNENVRVESNSISSISADRNQKKEKSIQKGIVFAKTNFTGVLKSVYVRLGLENIDHPEQQYHLVIGDKSKQRSFVSIEDTVEPGYFFMALPEGRYRIKEISIPVGSTLATEKMHIIFEVLPEKAVYLGTLQVIGTKEKIHFGGVPVFKPGFEYQVLISNEPMDAIEAFKMKYADKDSSFQTSLMKLEQLTNK